MNSMKSKFESLPYNEYFVSRRGAAEVTFEADYWGEVVDPDGVVRNIGIERDHKRELASEELSFINSLSPGKFLDIGCGTGSILEGINDEWDKHGIEVSKYATNIAQQYGNVFLGELHEAKYPDEFFDVVFLFHVIEHLKSPLDLLIEARRVLKSGGWLIVGTPDFDSACARRFGEKFRLLHDSTHISLFSNDSLHRMLSDHGFYVDHTAAAFFDTKYFTEENLLRLFNTDTISPPFYGNIMTKYCKKQSREEALSRFDALHKAFSLAIDGIC